ncbi:PhnA domain-containing protein [Marinigracilibium pacificum]|uniref:PhnA protein n=1 Tax=Marinigracilibium pacificum TaxID=2729599 RepID=A0A848IYR4_9BACT|nr:alkylphosphonate utilization protein [Marinigracilibium pacificum]NMM48776.1 PhnA protein [Marinigracilibium pacificum]
MEIKEELLVRSQNKCELCEASNPENIYTVPPATEGEVDSSIIICNTCLEHIEDPVSGNINHWRSIGNTMWSTVPAVQVMAWRTLNKLRDESWALDLLNILYLDEETKSWAEAGQSQGSEESVVHKDSNGVTLEAGDTVVLTKDLSVSGAGFTAKRGTAVRNISLVYDNAEQIEGKVNGQQIVILTKYVKKTK